MRRGFLLPLLLVTACSGDDDASDAAGPDGGGGAAVGRDGGRGGRAQGGGSGAGGGGPLVPPDASGGGASGGDGRLGEACAAQGDCRLGMTCLTSTGTALGIGGPPHGMCAVDCRGGDAAICGTLETPAACATFDGGTPGDSTDDVAYCLPECPMGSAVEPEFKCGGRPDVACTPSASTAFGLCLPACRNDEDCGERLCDIGSGLCVDARTGTAPIGADCAVDADCDGLCLERSPGHRECSGVCRVGERGCQQTTDATPPFDAACFLARVEGITYLGDAGYCVELCDCNDDCASASALCQDFALEAVSGRAGMCVPADQASPAAGTPCSGAGDAGHDASELPGEGGARDAATDARTTREGGAADARPGDAGRG